MVCLDHVELLLKYSTFNFLPRGYDVTPNARFKVFLLKSFILKIRLWTEN